MQRQPRTLQPGLLGDLWFVKGLLLSRLGAHAEAKHNLESALQPLREIHGPISLPVARCLRELSQLYAYQFVTDAAVGCVDEAVRLYEEVDTSYSGLGEALNTMAFVYSLTTRLQNFDVALTSHQRAYEILLSEGNETSFWAAQHLRSIGDILMMQEKNKEAAEYFERAAPLLEETCGVDPTFVSSCYSNLAVVYSRLGRVDEANVAQAKAVQLSERGIGSKEGVGEVSRDDPMD